MVRRIWLQITVLLERRKEDWIILKAVRFFTGVPENIKTVRRLESEEEKDQLVEYLIKHFLAKKKLTVQRKS